MKKLKEPCLPARAAAWILTFFLTAAITAAVLGAVAVHSITSEDAHIRIATDDRVIRNQMDQIAGEIRETAEAYAFPAEDVIGAIDIEEIRRQNTLAAEWWTRIVTDGIVEDMPEWHSPEVEEKIRTAMGEDSGSVYRQSAEVIREIEETVRRAVIPIRKSLVVFGIRYLEKRTDLPGVIRTVTRMPVLGGAAILLLSGLIALLCGGHIRTLIRCCGSALAGAGISVAAAMVLLYTANIQGIMAASSENLEQQFRLAMRTGAAECLTAVLVMLAAGFICLIISSRVSGTGFKGGKHAKNPHPSPDPFG